MLGEGLGLKGCELLIFAKIASFTRQGKTMFESEQSLANYTGYSKRKVISAMKSLLDQGLIVRSKQQTKYLTYEYTVSDDVKHKYLSKGGEKTSPVPVKKFTRTREIISPVLGKKLHPIIRRIV